MPVSTRSQIKTDPDQTDPNQNPLRNPHHGLKEKMKALTLLYEQQKQALKNPLEPPPQPPRFSSHPSVELSAGKRGGEKKEQTNVMKEKNSTVTRTYVLPQPPTYNAKENVEAGGGDRIVGFSCPRKAVVSTTVARKLSLGAQLEGRGGIGPKNLQEMDRVCLESKQNGESGGGSRILVFVRLRPMGKKEREIGARCCVRIVNRRDVYLTEFATENDYLRLKRLRGRHFTFDASFPESTTQLEVYSTT